MKDLIKLSGSVGVRGRNFSDDVRLIQALLNRVVRIPWALLAVDGVMGPQTIAHIKNFQRSVVGFSTPDGRIDINGKTWRHLVRLAGESQPAQPRNGPDTNAPPNFSANGKIAWGAKVSTPFKVRVMEICRNLSIAPDFLMACMAFETGETFSPSIKNAAGSGATGLIQFMPRTARDLGTTTEELEKMTAVKQLDYVERYFLPRKGRLKTLEDVYLAILYPAAIGIDPEEALFQRGAKTYEQNSGFDKNKDGKITPAEISIKVRQKYEKGLKEGYFG
ncbi:hypothetical protein [Microbulbifer celer]|uniref:EF-hand domain-containing protein n=1 Tax=Microbulbifer celer TaxID=435905 RepID=A0ABW3UAH5_9GAMM|nr:hypothetical protein [Microbulbifer celer]UFN57032.1 hypothetical protein LPW13_15920 [Microbulbifer celer]